MGKFVALKILNIKNKVYAQRFIRETKAMAKMDHPNIVKVYITGEDSAYNNREAALFSLKTVSKKLPRFSNAFKIGT